MIVDETGNGKNGKGAKMHQEELKGLRNEMVTNFKEQMTIR